MTSKFRVFLEKYFYFSMSILIAVVVAYGFSRTIDRRLIHPVSHAPDCSTSMLSFSLAGSSSISCSPHWSAPGTSAFTKR